MAASGSVTPSLRFVPSEARPYALPRAADALPSLGLGAMGGLGLAALALIELALGRGTDAAEHFEQLLEQPNLNDFKSKWRTDLAEAYVYSGRRDEAAATLLTLQPEAPETSPVEVRAAIERCRGLLAKGEEIDLYFGRSLSLLHEVDAPFEEARTALCFGEALRRDRRRRAARLPLRSALTAFEALGAVPWTERTRRELLATGERIKSRDPISRDNLTAREAQVGGLVAEGLTNRQIAGALYVTSKTVEYHLRQLYTKLGVRSRLELAQAFREGFRGVGD